MANSTSANSSSLDPVGQNILETVQKAGHYNRWLFSLIKPYLKGEIIEIGSGIGNFTSPLVQQNYQVTATDYNQVYLTNLTQKLSNLKTFNFDLTSVTVPRALLNKFDTAICLNVLEHIAEQNQALQNIYHTLKPGGKLIILVPAFRIAFGKLDINLGHIRRYTQKSLKNALVRNNFTVEKSRYLNPLGLFGWWVNSLLRRSTISPWQIWLFEFLSRPQLFVEKFISFPFGLSVLSTAVKQ